MSRVLKNAIIWVLALAVILCIIAGFTFGLSSVSGVADARGASIPSDNNGVPSANALIDSSADLILGSDNWYINPSADLYVDNEGYLNISYYWDASDDNRIIMSQLVDLGDVSEYRTIAGLFGVFTSTSTLNCDINFCLCPVDGDPYMPLLRQNTSNYQTFTYPDSSDPSLPDVSDQELLFCIFVDHYKFGTATAGTVTCQIKWLKVESGRSFTGYVHNDSDFYNKGYNAGVTDGTQTGYDEGYQEGYDEGYNNGLADEVYIASQGFKSSGYMYFSADVAGSTSKVEAVKKIGRLEDGYENVDIPLDGLFFAASDLVPTVGSRLVFPSDFQSITYDSVYEMYENSQYAMTFNTRLEQAQWLVDNPMDNLVLIPSNINNPSADGVHAIYFVMNDRSLLERFISGAGAAYDLGYQGGYNIGYDAGDEAGYNRGYGVGFNKGQADASSGNYTFLALIGSVLDAPISAFKGLLDFELLGVNMSSFVLAIMSLCVIIVIIRVVLR